MASPVKADIELLFGVLGGGEISGQSGIRIKSEIDSIVAKLNTAKEVNNRGILFTLNRTKSREKIVSGVQQICKDFDKQKQLQDKFGVNLTVKKIDTSAAIAKFKSDLETMLNQLKVKTGFEVKVSDSGVTSATQQTAQATKRASDEATASAQKELATLQQLEAMQRKIATSYNTAASALKNYTAARSGKSAGDYSGLQAEASSLESLNTQIGSLIARLKSGGTVTQQELDKIAAGFSTASTNAKSYIYNIKNAGEATKTLGSKFKSLTEKFSMWLTTSQIIMQLYRGIRKMITTVIDLDTAMTELRKVTDETEDTYVSFLEKATDRAEKLGATISDVVSASANFARLGFSLEESASLADAALVYKNVGDGIEDINVASESIISTMKAFGVEAENAMSIVDKFNIAGNKFAISSGGIGEALKRSAAALSTAGNSIDESIAMATAMNEILQNPETVGTSLKTLSMYLRAAKTEADAAGESTDGMAGSVSELRDELLALTGQRVDIMADDSTFKSTYKIMQELSRVWDDLTDDTRANITELIAGKRNANAVSALLTNFETAEKAMLATANATGSAMAENEKYLESIQGHISRFKAAFQELSTTTIDGDLIKGIVDIGTFLVQILNTLMEIVDALGGLKTIGIGAGIIALTKNIVTAVPHIRNLALGVQTVGTAAQVASTKFLAFSLAIGAAVGLLSVIKWLSEANERAVEKAEELSKTYEEQRRIAESNTKALSDMKDEFVELSKGVDDTGENISLTSDKYERYLDLANQIADMNPSLVHAYDEEGNAILRRNEQLSNGNKLLEEAIRLQEEYAGNNAGEYTSDKNINVLADGASAKIEEAEKEFRTSLTNNSYDNVYQVVGAIANKYYGSYLPAYTGNSFNAFTAVVDHIDEIAERIKTNQDGFIADISGSAIGQYDNTILGSILDETDIATALGNILYEYNVMVSRIDAANGELQDVLQSVPVSVTTVYKDLDDTQRKFLSSYISNLEVTSDSIHAQKDDIVGLTKALGGELSGYYVNGDYILGESANSLLDMADHINDNVQKMTFSEYDKVMKDAMRYLERQKFDAEIDIAFKTLFGVSSDSSGEKYTSDVSTAFNELKRILDEEGDKALEEMSVDQYMDLYIAIKDSGAFGGRDGIYSIRDIINFKAQTEEPIVLSAEVKGMSDATGRIEKLHAILESLNGAEKLDVSILDDLGDLLPESINQITDVESAISAVEEAIGSAESEASYRFSRILMTNLDTVDGIINGNEDLRAALTTLYGEDASNWQTLADGKWRTDAALVQQLSSLWSKYLGYTEDEIRAKVKLYEDLQRPKSKPVLNRPNGNKDSQAVEFWDNSDSPISESEYNSLKAYLEFVDAINESLDFNLPGDREPYVPDLGLFRGTMEELDDIRRLIADYEFQIENTDDVDEQIRLHGLLATEYNNERIALEKLNGQYDDLIVEKAGALKSKYGISYAYNKSTDDLEFTNLEKEFSKLSVKDQKIVEELIKELDGLEKENADLAASARDAALNMNGENDTISKLSSTTEDAAVKIERYREELYALSKIQLSGERIDMQIDAEDDPANRAQLIKDRIQLYKDEQAAHHALAEARREDISNNLTELSGYGITYTYDSANNDLFINNLEDINDLAPDVRESVLELAEETIEMNDANKDASNSWWDLNYAIGDAKVNIVDALMEISSAASETLDTVQGVYDTLHSAADEFAANGGFISVDTFQDIINLGPQYMQYLKDENGLLAINEERIQDVIAAKTEQLGVDTALSYVKRIEAVLNGDSSESLVDLLYATQATTGATWDLVYANLANLKAIGLTDAGYEAACQNIEALASMARNAADGVFGINESLSDDLNSMKDGLDSIIGYTMDMIKQKVENQIDAIEDQKDAFAEYIDMQKESLDLEKENSDYKKAVSKKVKEIAKIQSQLDALAMDDSREAQAERVKLQEELAELQEELSETQSEKAVETQKDALDRMNEDYAASKDEEVHKLEDSISSEQKLYDLAIDYISNNWRTLYDDLLAWNTQYGSTLETELVSAWAEAEKAVKRYGSVVNAQVALPSAIEAANGSSNGSGYLSFGGSKIVGVKDNRTAVGNIIQRMWQNSQAWHTASKDERSSLEDETIRLGTIDLAQLGVKAVRGSDGVWYIDRVGGKKLYDEYDEFCTYHSGGIVGGASSMRENELLAKLEEGEAVISNKNKGNLYSLIDFVGMLSKKLDLSGFVAKTDLPKTGGQAIDSMIGGKQVTITMGDVIIQGNADQATVAKHAQINRDTVNQIARILNVKL